MTRLWEYIETITIVTLITLLVWVYAEVENVKEYETTFSIRFVAAPGGPELALSPSAPQQVRVRYRCSTSQRDQVESLTSQPIEVPVTANPANPRKIQNLREAIRSDFEQLGVEVIDARNLQGGDTVEVVAVPLITRELPVDVIAGDVTLTGKPDVDPQRIKVTIPMAEEEQLRGQTLFVRLDELPDIGNMSLNVPHTRNLPVRHPTLLALPYAKAEPPRVTVTFAMQQKTRTLTLQRPVPIREKLPIGLSSVYQIVPDAPEAFLQEKLELSGPADVLDRIERGEIQLEAVLTLDQIELQENADTDRYISKPVSIQLPQGVRLIRPDPVPSIRFQVKKK